MSSRLTSESRIYADKARDLNRQVSLLSHEQRQAKFKLILYMLSNLEMYGVFKHLVLNTHLNDVVSNCFHYHTLGLDILCVTSSNQVVLSYDQHEYNCG